MWAIVVPCFLTRYGCTNRSLRCSTNFPSLTNSSNSSSDSWMCISSPSSTGRVVYCLANPKTSGNSSTRLWISSCFSVVVGPTIATGLMSGSSTVLAGMMSE